VTEFTDQDRKAFAQRGVTESEIEGQISLFRNPPPPIALVRPCSPGDGVHQLPPDTHAALLRQHASAAGAGRMTRFVPASGAASRMFKDLLETRDLPGEKIAASPVAARLRDHLEEFAFGASLRSKVTAAGESPDDPGALLAGLLDKTGLHYAALPKGLLLFHRYADGPRTSFEEHLVEAADVVRDEAGAAQLHFTISPEHGSAFERHARAACRSHGERLGTRFKVSFSTQDPATDTLAVDEDNRPFRREDGSLLFRPGGHGALLANVSGLGGDLVLVKNIDNVVPDDRKAPTLLWKRLLAGLLVRLEREMHEVLRDLDRNRNDAEAIERGLALATTWLGHEVAEECAVRGLAGGEALYRRFHRPLRVCGVVPSQGEPGGGPFWVRSPDGRVSPQIVESSQVDADNREQQTVWSGSTHFNPVDLALAVCDYRGQPYALDEYVDPATVFLSLKSHGGRTLKALERPGLWNGAMAHWNTVFVEVPIETFAPVKTVFDLLRPQHQPSA